MPLPPGTPYEAGLLFCQIVATVVAQKHPQMATIERERARRAARRVYVDYLQNILGKTLATAYSARASDYAGVSTPLTWKEIDEGVRREDFTIQTMPARFARVGDLWEGLRRSKGAGSSRVARYAESAGEEAAEGAGRLTRRRFDIRAKASDRVNRFPALLFAPGAPHRCRIDAAAAAGAHSGAPAAVD